MNSDQKHSARWNKSKNGDFVFKIDVEYIHIKISMKISLISFYQFPLSFLKFPNSLIFQNLIFPSYFQGESHLPKGENLEHPVVYFPKNFQEYVGIWRI